MKGMVQVLGKLEDSSSYVVSKLYSNMCREAVDLLRLSIENGKFVKYKKIAEKMKKPFLNYDWKINRNMVVN